MNGLGVGEMSGREAWLDQGAMCGSEDIRVRGQDQDGETKAGLGGVVRVRGHRISTRH